jgi:hypothetical protein
MDLPGGMAHLLMQQSGMMHTVTTCTFLKVDTSSQMQASELAMCYLSPIEVYIITLKSGVWQKICKFSYSQFILAIDKYSSPQNAKELFNLQHSSLQNIIECIFGVMKHQWHIL